VKGTMMISLKLMTVCGIRNPIVIRQLNNDSSARAADAWGLCELIDLEVIVILRNTHND
jgi:hypothetical protein